MIDFRINTFLTLSKVLNYTKTAQLLHITQPAVSQHIKFLENKYGVKLFKYDGRNLNLTRAGETLYDFSLAMKSSSDKILKALPLLEEENYNLKFGTTLTIGEYIMSPLLKDIIKKYPNIRITMIVGNTKNLLEKLKSGEIDFAILEGHFDKSKYSSKVFSKENFIGVCAQNNILSNKKIDFDEIFNQRLIFREVGSGTREIFEKILYEQNNTMNSFKDILEIGNISVIKNLVKNNFGITFLYEKAVEIEISNGELMKLDIKDFNIKREFNFVYLKNSLHEKEYLNWFDLFKEKNPSF